MENKQLVGKVINLNDSLKTKADQPRFTFNIEDCPYEFSGFGKPGFKEGEEIDFEYAINDKTGTTYYNFKKLTDAKILPVEQVKVEEAKKIDVVQKDYVLMHAAVNLCIERSKKNPIFLSDKEIYACYENMSNYLKNGLPRETTPESS